MHDDHGVKIISGGKKTKERESRSDRRMSRISSAYTFSSKQYFSTSKRILCSKMCLAKFDFVGNFFLLKYVHLIEFRNFIQTVGIWNTKCRVSVAMSARRTLVYIFRSYRFVYVGRNDHRFGLRPVPTVWHFFSFIHPLFI